MDIKLEILKDCWCEGYLHEIRYYPREGLKEKILKKGDIVKFIREWWNLYGSYVRVEKDGIEYDVLLNNVKQIK